MAATNNPSATTSWTIQTRVRITSGAPRSPPISRAITQPTSSTGSTNTPSRIRKMNPCVIDGGVWPTSMVHGISRSATILRNLNHAIVGAKDPMPSVSKKLVTAPKRMASAFGRLRWRTTALSRTMA